MPYHPVLVLNPLRHRLTEDQKRALRTILEAEPNAYVDLNRWTAASSLIRAGLVEKKPAPPPPGALRSMASGVRGRAKHPAWASYTLTPVGKETAEALK